MGCKAVEMGASVGCVKCGQCDNGTWEDDEDTWDDFEEEEEEND